MTVRNLEGFFKPRHVVVLGEPVGETATTLMAHLRGSSASAALIAAIDAIPAGETNIVGVVADPAALSPALLEDLAARGCRALIWPHGEHPEPTTLHAARTHTTRLLGPRSPGLLLPHHGLTLSALPGGCAKGSLALIAQSQSVAAAAVDWAIGRNIGFSWVAVSGGESDVDISDLLDYAALDPSTRAVALEVGHIAEARKFMSAARACARAKPVVVIQTRSTRAKGKGPDRVRSAAFARAGLVECQSLPGLLDAIAALHRLPVLRRARVLVVSNGSGICALGVDAVLRQNLEAAEPAAETQTRVRAQVPAMREIGGGADLGDCAADATVGALRLYLEDRETDAVLFIRSPLGRLSHAEMAASVAAAGFNQRLLTVWLGLDSALPARRLSAEADSATFTSPDAAARAIRYRWEYSRNRELLTQTPPPDSAARIDAAEVTARLERLAEHGVRELRGDRAAALLDSYGVPAVAGTATNHTVELQVSLSLHPELGLHLSCAVRAAGVHRCGYGFAPLDALLARRILADAGLEDGERDCSAADLEALAQGLVRIGQIGLDQPLLAGLDLCLLIDHGHACCRADSVRIKLGRPPGPERTRLALAPYPAHLVQVHRCHGQDYLVRPVRPDDEPALIRLLQGLDPEAVRLRFFIYLRHFSHDMAARMTQIDYDRELALVIQPRDGTDRIFGIGTLIADPDNARAEFAVLMDGAHAGQGLGEHLLRRLLSWAQERRVQTVYGEVLAENRPMLGLARKLGMTVRAMPDDPGCMHVQLAMAHSA